MEKPEKEQRTIQPRPLEKERVNITFTKPYIDFMNRLVRTGLYFNRGAVMMEALRVLAKEHGIPIINEEAGL